VGRYFGWNPTQVSKNSSLLKTPNLDYRRLADQLVDRGMIANEAMQHVFQECSSKGLLMPEVLVNEGLISDLEISRICTDLFHLPFIPLDVYEPSKEALEGLDLEYLRQYGLVPLDRFGDLMTVSMPGIVPTSVLEGLSQDDSINILPVVGTVNGNRRWIEENMASKEETAMKAFNEAITDEEASWGNLFDEADESVKQGLQPSEEASGLDSLDLEFPELDVDSTPVSSTSCTGEASENEDDDLFDLDALDGLDDLI